MAGTAKLPARKAMLTAFAGLMLAGCGKSPAPTSDSSPATPAPQQQSSVASTSNKTSMFPIPQAASFKDAVLADPPFGQNRPPERTVAGKSVGKLYEAVAGTDGVGGLWDQVVFITPEGKPIQYHAVIRTDVGNVKIELWPEIAPNHVRNFIALARAGYYDGLFFDRTVRDTLVGQKDEVFEYVEAGCPLGLGDPGQNSIGYWLKPEFSDKVKHEEGTVGACHSQEVETAGVRFYINLSKAPWMDAGDDGNGWTIFGKVTEGMDVLRAILARPTRTDELISDRPREPVAIQEVTIHSKS